VVGWLEPVWRMREHSQWAGGGRARKSGFSIAEIKDWPNWVMRRGKVPLNPRTGGRARVNETRDWTDAATAWRASQRYGSDGIGFVFTRECGVVGIDLDDCLVEGRINGFGAQIVQMLDSYTEISPSGRGLHVLAAGRLERAVKQEGIEMYGWGRYFTMTGDGFLHYGEREICERQQVLDALTVTLVPGLLEMGDGWAPVKQMPAAGDSFREIRRALAHLPKKMAYDEWLTVLMAVHSEMPGSEGVKLIEGWSPGSAGEVEAKFRSFQRSGVGLGSLFSLAGAYGYRAGSVRAGDLRGAL